jgi:1,4-alpha-glucan branching enzyme
MRFYNENGTGPCFFPLSPGNILLLLMAISFVVSGCSMKAAGPVVLDEGVRFSFHAPEARTVALTGSFNRWDPEGLALSRTDDDGDWSVTVPLGEGIHEYMFVVNGDTWVKDPGAPSVDDGFGGNNSVVLVGR